MSKRTRNFSTQSSRDASPQSLVRETRKKPKIEQLRMDKRPPVAGDEGSKPKRQGKGALIPPMDSHNAPKARGMSSLNAGGQPSPTPGWKNSRDFQRNPDSRTSNSEDDNQHDNSPDPRAIIQRPTASPVLL